jgi:hypothetical protein
MTGQPWVEAPLNRDCSRGRKLFSVSNVQIGQLHQWGRGGQGKEGIEVRLVQLVNILWMIGTMVAGGKGGGVHVKMANDTVWGLVFARPEQGIAVVAGARVHQFGG